MTPDEALADSAAKERQTSATAPEAASWLIDPTAQTSAPTVCERLAALLPQWEAEPEWKEPA